MNRPAPRGTTYTGRRGCSTRTGRVRLKSLRFSSSISPFTPRSRPRVPAAPNPVQSSTVRTRARSPSLSVHPKWMLHAALREGCGEGGQCRRADPGAPRRQSTGALAKRPASSGSRAAMAAASTVSKCSVRRPKWARSARVARVRDHQRAIEHRAGEVLAPPRHALHAQLRDQRLGALHARTTAPASRRRTRSRPLKPSRAPRSNTSTSAPRSSKLQRAGKPCDASADDGDTALR